MADSAVVKELFGYGSPEADLSSDELRLIVEHALLAVVQGEKVLAIGPDKTRDDNTARLFPFAAQILTEKKVARLDLPIARGNAKRSAWATEG